MYVTNENITAILEGAGMDGGEVKLYGGGKYNESYLVECENEKYILRIAPADNVPKLFYEKKMMRSEPDLHQFIRDHTSLPIPEVIFHDFSRERIDRDYLILEFMEGESGPFDHAELGGYVRQLHELHGLQFGYPGRDSFTGESWPTVFREYFRLIMEDCRLCGIMTDEEADYFLSCYQANQGAVQECEPRLLHLDLWSQNILTKNGKISAIIDFDRGLYGDPELEFAVLDTYGYSTKGFFTGYGKTRPENEEALVRQKLYIVYELIKYAFIRYARNQDYATGRSHVEHCRMILSELE